MYIAATETLISSNNSFVYLQAWDQCSGFCTIMHLISEKYTLFFWYSWTCVTWNMLLFLLAILYILECASTWEAVFFKSFEINKTDFHSGWIFFFLIQWNTEFWRSLVDYFLYTWNVDYLFIWSEVIFLFRQNLFKFGLFFSEVE